MLLVKNKKAHLEYQMIDTFQAGVVLMGAEVKSLRQKTGSLTGAFVKIIQGEAFLLGALIPPYAFSNLPDYDPQRTRKLLLSKKELYRLQEASAVKGQTLVPLSFELMHNKIKLSFAVAKGKKQYEKRSQLKAKAQLRDAEKEIKNKTRWK